MEHAVQAITSLVANARERDRIRCENLELAIRVTVFTTTFAPIPFALRSPSDEEFEAFAREIADMLVRYLVRAETASPSSVPE